MIGGIGAQEIIIILIVGLLVFGAARLPKIARSLGLGIKEFKKTVKSIEDDDEESGNKVKYVPNQTQGYQGQQPPQGTYAQSNTGPQAPNMGQNNTPPNAQNYSGTPQPQAPGPQNPAPAQGQNPQSGGPPDTDAPPRQDDTTGKA